MMNINLNKFDTKIYGGIKLFRLYINGTKCCYINELAYKKIKIIGLSKIVLLANAFANRKIHKKYARHAILKNNPNGIQLATSYHKKLLDPNCNVYVNEINEIVANYSQTRRLQYDIKGRDGFFDIKTKKKIYSNTEYIIMDDDTIIENPENFVFNNCILYKTNLTTESKTEINNMFFSKSKIDLLGENDLDYKTGTMSIIECIMRGTFKLTNFTNKTLHSEVKTSELYGNVTINVLDPATITDSILIETSIIHTPSFENVISMCSVLEGTCRITDSAIFNSYMKCVIISDSQISDSDIRISTIRNNKLSNVSFQHKAICEQIKNKYTVCAFPFAYDDIYTVIKTFDNEIKLYDRLGNEIDFTSNAIAIKLHLVEFINEIKESIEMCEALLRSVETMSDQFKELSETKEKINKNYDLLHDIIVNIHHLTNEEYINNYKNKFNTEIFEMLR